MWGVSPDAHWPAFKSAREHFFSQTVLSGWNPDKINSLWSRGNVNRVSQLWAAVTSCFLRWCLSMPRDWNLWLGFLLMIVVSGAAISLTHQNNSCSICLPIQYVDQQPLTFYVLEFMWLFKDHPTPVEFGTCVLYCKAVAVTLAKTHSNISLVQLCSAMTKICCYIGAFMPKLLNSTCIYSHVIIANCSWISIYKI